LVEIRNGLQQQLEAIDSRIENVRRELKEAQTVRAELRLDLDYVEARLAGQSAEALLEQQSKTRAKPASKK
jgi:septal ring factor EnvC (AmiA/AmiB activator)